MSSFTFVITFVFAYLVLVVVCGCYFMAKLSKQINFFNYNSISNLIIKKVNFYIKIFVVTIFIVVLDLNRQF